MLSSPGKIVEACWTKRYVILGLNIQVGLATFRFFRFFSLNLHFASIFSLNFRFFYLCFRFRFLVFRIEVNHMKSGFFFASKRNKIFASISNFASEAKVRAHPSRELQIVFRKGDKE